RRARELTLASVAKQVGCAESQLSYIESGRRTLHPWLASSLDRLYETGGVINGMVRNLEEPTHQRPDTEILTSDVLLVPSPYGGELMPVPRRDLLAYIGTG